MSRYLNDVWAWGDWSVWRVPCTDPVAGKNWYLCEFPKPLLWRTVLYNICRGKLSEYFVKTEDYWPRANCMASMASAANKKPSNPRSYNWRWLLPQYFLLPQKIAAEKVAAVCVSFRFQCSDWRSTCDHDEELCGGRSERYKQSRYDQRGGERGRGTTDCEGGTYFTHWVVICQAFAPNYSDLISAPNILWMCGAYYEELTLVWPRLTLFTAFQGRGRAACSAWPAGSTTRVESRAEVSQPTSCFLKVTPCDWRHWRLSWHVTHCQEYVIGDVEMLTGSGIPSQM